MTSCSSPTRGFVSPPFGRGRAPVWFKKMDRNGDGDVSAREFNGPPSLFQRMDPDGDGLISPEEARAYEKAMKK